MSHVTVTEAYLAERRALVERALVEALSGPESPLSESMRYSVFAGGKRLRPILVLAAADAVGGNVADALHVAVAFELVHTQSLIYDDLPCMDDDDLRRGIPTNHRVFGEVTALLAGSALMARAYAWIAEAPVPAERRLAAITELSAATDAICRGQLLDMQSQDQAATPIYLQLQHRLKTGALIAGALRAGAAVAGGDPDAVARLGRYGEELGLAFQIVDDLLDADETPDQVRPGRDEAAGKLTYPALFGRDDSRRLAQEAGQRALDELEGWDEAVGPLRSLVGYVLRRTH